LDDAKIGRVAAQHTAAELAGQPAREVAGARSWRRGTPPWIVLAVWLAVHSAGVIYWAANAVGAMRRCGYRLRAS